MVAQTAPKTKVTLKLLRDGKERTLAATLGELPAEQQLASAEGRARPGRAREMEGLAGIEVADVDSRFRQQFDIPSDVRGAIVTSVNQESKAYEAGLRPGNIILEVNRQKIANTRELTEAVRKARGGRALLRVWSPGGGRFVVIEPETKRTEQE